MASRALTVNIVGDVSGFSGGLKKAEASSGHFGKSIENLHHHVRGHFLEMGKEVLKGAAAFGAAYTTIEGAKRAIESTDQLAKATLLLHRNFGLTIQSASEWAAVAKSRDIDPTALHMGFTALSRATEAASVGTKKQADAFKALGISQKDIKGGQQDFASLLTKVQAGFEGLHGGTQRAALAQSLFGRGARTLLPLLRSGELGFKAQAEQANKFGATLKDSSVKSLEKLVAQQRTAKFATMGLQNAFALQLAPALTKAIGGFTSFIARMREGTPVTRAISKAISAVKDVVNTVADAVSNWSKKNRADLTSLSRGFSNVAHVISAVFTEVVRRLLPVWRATFDAAVANLRGVIRIIGGVLTGNWSKAWQGLKDVVKNTGKLILTILKALGSGLLDATEALGKLIVRGIVSGLKGLAKAVAHAVVSGVTAGAKDAGKLIDKINPFSSITGNIIGGTGDGIGKGLIGAGGVLPSGGAFGGSLKGARSSLRPFAAIGSRFGLGVSDGRRPAGTRTASGGISYHSTGEAIDMADGRGPDANKLSFFRYMKSHFGGRLAELIYTPGGAGIKDGRPFRYTGAVAADHFDHVHVAFDSGRPGVGDGIGIAGPSRGSLDQKREGLNLMRNIWGKASGFLPGAGRMPPTSFTHGANALFIGADDTGHVYWPDWFNKDFIGADGPRKWSTLETLIHEWAHTRQKKSLSMWEGEGGAVAFARRVSPLVYGALGIKYRNPPASGEGPYAPFLSRVKRERGEDWIMRGQFMGGGRGRAGRAALGRFTATSYGPPWDAMNGSGTTATGVNLRGAPHRYGVAVDPNVIPLGSKLKISPNPFGYGGLFTAFDTGGAIKGKHIDFYDWRGRPAQNGWGSRKVTISTPGHASSRRGKHPAPYSGPRTGTSGGSAGGLSENMTQQGQQDYRDASGIGDGTSVDAAGHPADAYADGGDGASPPTTLDFLDANLARAEGTSDASDDLYYQRLILGEKQRLLGEARKTNDPRLIAAAQREVNSTVDAIKALTDATNLAADTQKRMVDLLAGVKDELAAIRTEAASLNSIGYREALRFIADSISGQVVGVNLQGRRQTAGNGVVAITP